MIIETSSLPQETFSTLDKSTQFRGTFHYSGLTRVAGTIEGELQGDHEDRLVLEFCGKIKGTLTCHHAEIHGSFDGKIICDGTLTFFSYCSMQGEIMAKKLIIQPGAKINAKIQTFEK